MTRSRPDRKAIRRGRALTIGYIVAFALLVIIGM